MRVRSVTRLSRMNGLTKGASVARERLRSESRWSIIVRPAAPLVHGHVELGELFGVHRGQVTGANDIWIAGEHARAYPIASNSPRSPRPKTDSSRPQSRAGLDQVFGLGDRG